MKFPILGGSLPNMETYPNSLTAVCAPLLVIQGVGDSYRPKSYTGKKRTNENASVDAPEVDYGVQLDIHRELDDVSSPVVGELVDQLQASNVRNRKWWPNTNNQSLWFNIMYADSHYDLLVNGSQSVLSPYRKNSKFTNSLVPLEWMVKYYNKIPVGFISVYELGDDDEYDVILINEILRMKHQFDGTLTRFYCLIYTNGPIGEERSLKIRQKSEMQELNSLFFVTNASNESTINDRHVFVNKLLQILKRHAADFFNNQIKKLKVREAKEPQTPELLFTTRFLIKFSIFELIKGVSEYSTNLIVKTHSKLMKLLIEHKNLTPQTNFQISSWLDIFTIHIVRSMIIMGSFNKPYIKLKTHINTICKAKGFDLNWISNQLTWFAQLLEEIGPDSVPLDYSILPLDTSTTPAPANKTPHVGFLYLEALRYKEMSINKGTQTPSSDGDNRLLLLNGALDMFSSARNAKFLRIESMIFIKIGEIYYQDGNLSMALNNFKAGLSNYTNWDLIRASVLWKMVNCFTKMGNVEDSWKVIVELTCFDSKVVTKLGGVEEWENKLKDSIASIKKSSSLAKLEQGNKLLSIECVIKSRQVTCSQSIDYQLEISQASSKLPLVKDLELSSIEILMTNGEKVVITNESADEQLEFYNLNSSSLSCPLKITSKKLKLQFQLQTHKPGDIAIQDIVVIGELNQMKLTGKVDVKYPTIGYWIDTDDNNEIIYPLQKTVASSENSVKVIPREPKVNLQLEYSEVAYNGQKFPVIINLTNEDTMDIKVHINGRGELTNVKLVQSVLVDFDDDDNEDDNDNSKGHKDEYRSPMLSPSSKMSIGCHLTLPQLFKLPYDKKTQNLVVKFNVKYLDGGSVTQVERICHVSVVELFKFSSRVHPVISENIQLKEEDVKRWKFKLDCINLSYDSLTVGDFKVKVKSIAGFDLSESINNKMFGQVLGYKSTGQVEITLNISSKVLVKSVPIEIAGEMTYSKGGEENKFVVSSIFNGILPHNESRVLVAFKPPRIEYTLENPTPERTLFQTNMSNENGGVAILNEYAKSSNIAVEPYSSRQLQFEYQVDEGVKMLPEFTVFDKIHGKFKKVLTVSDNLEWNSNQLFYTPR